MTGQGEGTMAPAPATATGLLDVEVRSGPYALASNIAVEVRDSSMRLVSRSPQQRHFDLPVGLYEVSAVLEDGRKHSTLVQVKGGERTPVELGSDAEVEAPASPPPTTTRSLLRYEPPRFTRRMAAAAGTETEPVVDTVVELVDVQGATLERQTRTLWIFHSTDAMDAVPSACIRIAGRLRSLSLPISSCGGTPSNVCAVRIEQSGSAARAQAWISPERSVANALQNMLASGYVLEAADVAADAVELLRDKYNDPTGAALGALILYKTGRLEGWTGWVENLARDFPWLPDGAVILASLLASSEAGRDRALDLAFQAGARRMLYTESYSLLLALLRRWPREARQEERHAALAAVAARAPYVDWDTICFSYGFPEDE